VLVAGACNPTKRLGKNEVLVDQNKVIVHGKAISASELLPVTRTQPNRKILKTRFHLWLYNLANPERAMKRQDKINNRKWKIKRDTRRARKGKSEKSRRKSLGNWLLTSAGEPPAILDSAKVYTSRKNLNLYLVKMGYFENEVYDSLVIDTVKKRASVFYVVKPGMPYYIDTIVYVYKDKRLFRQIEKNLDESLIKTGQIININQLDEERNRIANTLRDKGYYSFTKDYIKFRIDSSETSHKVDVSIVINQALIKAYGKDSLIEDNHKQYTINKIYITVTPTDIVGRDDTRYDTLAYADRTGDTYYFLHKGRLMYKPSAMLEHIYLKPDLYYRSKEVEATYKKLTGLNTFRVVNINLYEDHSDIFQPGLEAKVQLTPMRRHMFVTEATGTNRGGNLGASANISYKNRNIFRGAEQLALTLQGGIEAQQLLTNQGEQVVGGVVSEILPLSTFNTVEFGPEVSLTFPKFLVPFNVFKFSKNSRPKTVFNAKFNYQRRPDFSRAIQEASLAYDWVKINEQSHEEFDFHFSPLKLSAVKLPRLSDQFRSHLNVISDPLLRYSYTDHIVLGILGGVTYTVQKNNRTKDMLYLKFNAEQSGISMYNIFKLSNAERDSIGSYEILGIRFAHFVKTDLDFRYFINLNKSSRMAYRTMIGIGVPMANLNEALPFEKAFYAGGANGLRGWRARTVGPGGYYDTIARFDKIGEFQLEGNLEYRFDLVKVIEGALFVDAGNIWLLRKNDGRPQGHITPLFYEQIAMDAGIGLRLDFDFFIFRFDFAVPLRDPGFPVGEKWLFQPKTQLNEWRKGYASRNPEYVYKPYRFPVTFNFAIGYPF
jgi:hypothetical protein